MGGRRGGSRRPVLREKADWVYRSSVRAIGTQLPGNDTLGTYEALVRGQSSGVTNATALILYDSQNRRMATGRFAAGPGGFQAAGIAGGRSPRVLGVEGSIYVEPSSWAVGNLIAHGMRVCIFEQDVASGSALLDVDYSMWANATTSSPADWVNQGRSVLLERRRHHGFSQNQTFFTAGFRWRGRRVLAPHEGLFLYLELESTSVNVRFQTWFRSLVADEA